jgi:small-conductance mechanosensitive channel
MISGLAEEGPPAARGARIDAVSFWQNVVAHFEQLDPRDAAGQDYGGDLDQIGKDENFIEQMPLVKSQVLYEIWRLFQQQGIRIPYPKRDLYVRSDAPAILAEAGDRRRRRS